jgi:hypothetical protein
MGDVVNFPISLDNEQGRALILDLARYREGGLITEAAIRKKYRLADEVWGKLGDDDELIRKVEEESTRRIRDGSAKREKSQQLVIRAPDVLSGILLDAGANAKHRIDSAKLLNDFSDNGPGQSAPASDRFVITIVMNDQVERYDKSIAVDVNDSATGAIAAIAAKREDGSSGEPV